MIHLEKISKAKASLILEYPYFMTIAFVLKMEKNDNIEAFQNLNQSIKPLFIKFCYNLGIDLLLYKRFFMFAYENENEKRNNNDLSFPEEEVKLAKTMMDELGTTMEFFHYLMNHREKSSLTIILLSADDLNLDNLLPKWKRQTDILFELDKVNNVYVIICQSTDRDGGKQFAEILMSNIHMHGDCDTYCVVSESKTTTYPIQEVIFKMVEKYIGIKEDKKANRVFFTRFENIENTDITYYT